MSVEGQSLVCGARTNRGGRCKHSPTPGSDPPRCHLHSKARYSADGRARCKGRSAERRRCPLWAVRGGEYCARHMPGIARGQEGERRCAALTAKGKPCRALAVTDSDPPRCTFHGPRKGRGKRCGARTKRGRRCRGWATQESVAQGKPLCRVHGGRCRQALRGARGQRGRRCEARTQAGERCGHWAMRDSERRYGRALCNFHALPSAWRRPGPESRSRGERCTARTASGERCGKWAMRESKERYGSWLCLLHAEGGQAVQPGPQSLARNGRQCTARTQSGERCRHWALSDESWPGDEPLCALHAGRDIAVAVRHGYYSKRPNFSAEERAAILQAVEEGEPLAAEVLIVRLKLRRLLQYMGREDLAEWRRDAAARALFKGVGVVKRLMEARYNLARIRWRPSSGGNSGMQLASLLQEEE